MNFEEVKEKLKEKGYIILDKYYKNNKEKMNLEKDGYKFFISWNGLTRTWNPKLWGINNPYSIYNVNKFFEKNNYTCRVVSENYDNKKMDFICQCGNVYSTSIDNVILKKQMNCKECSIKIRSKKQMNPKYEELLNYHKLRPIQEYKNSSDTIYCLNKNGYYLFLTTYNLSKESKNYEDSIFSYKNKFIIENIKNYIRLNNIDIKLLSTEINKDKKIELKCKCGSKFITDLYTFIGLKKYLCNRCSSVKASKSRMKDKEYVFYENGLTPIEKYKGVNKRIYCKTEEGYYVYCSVEGIERYNNINSTIFHSCNKYVIENIKLFIKNNDLDVELLSEEYTGTHDKLKFKCSCGNIFYNNLDAFKRGIGQKCKGCGKKSVISKMEESVEKYLKELNIENYREKIFVDCKDKYCLPFDFYLPQYNSCIECQGKQHFEAIEYFGGIEHLNYVKHHDKIKKDYCNNNNIGFLEISYLDFKNNEWKEKINKTFHIKK